MVGDMTTPTRVPHGLLIVDKPGGPSSHGVVAATRRALGTRKVGHAGTLDPMATGVLVLGVGHATRLLTYIVGADKAYDATIRLGVTTTTEDAQGDVVSFADPERLARVTDDAVAEALSPLRGEILQIPSAVSAIKIDGKRAYQRVRDGEAVELTPRPVTIHAFDVVGRRAADIPDARGAIDLDVHVECSSGTYVRALARDLGDALGVGAHLTALRRTRVGPFSLDEAIGLDALSEAGERGDATRSLIPLAQAASRILPRVELTTQEAIDLGHGKRVHPQGGLPPAATPTGAFAPDGRLIGVVVTAEHGIRPLMNVPEDRG